MSLPSICTISGNLSSKYNSIAPKEESLKKNKQKVSEEPMFFFFVAEQLEQQVSSSSCSSTCCFDPTMQSFLNKCKIKIMSRSCLEKELACKSGSKILAQAFISEQKVSCCITTKRAQELKRDFFMSWSEKTLSNLQLLNAAKICLEMSLDTKDLCKFFLSDDPDLDGDLIRHLFFLNGGLKLEKNLLKELLICLPWDRSEGSDFILQNQDVVWGHFAATLLNNYPPHSGRPRKISLDQILKVLVTTVQGLGSGFSPSSKFKQFVLDNKGHKDFLANSSITYVKSLFDFYQKHMQEDDAWWLVGCNYGNPRTRFSNRLTDADQHFVFNNLKA